MRYSDCTGVLLVTKINHHLKEATGTLINNSGISESVGYWSKTWTTQNLIDFTGVVRLENDK